MWRKRLRGGPALLPPDEAVLCSKVVTQVSQCEHTPQEVGNVKNLGSR